MSDKTYEFFVTVRTDGLRDPEALAQQIEDYIEFGFVEQTEDLVEATVNTVSKSPKVPATLKKQAP